MQFSESNNMTGTFDRDELFGSGYPAFTPADGASKRERVWEERKRAALDGGTTTQTFANANIDLPMK